VTIEQSINESRGFLDLGAPLKALEIVERLSPWNRAHPEVVSLRLAVAAALEKWEHGLERLGLMEPSGEPQHRKDCATFCRAYARRHLVGQGQLEDAQHYVN
jgi:hypothetical protein